MPTTLRHALCLVLLTSLSACAAGAPSATRPVGAIGSQASSEAFAGGTAGVPGSAKATGGSAAVSPTSPTTGSSGANASSGASATGTGSAHSATSGIGLSTFFDTYNFNFPVPEGQAVGTVANASQKLVKAAGGHVYLQIGLQTLAKASTSTHPALNVAFVFDHSGSMYGEKIQYSRVAAEHFVDQLSDKDRFGLVTFDSTVDTLIPPALVTDKPSLKAQIEGILTGSSTNIDGGLTEGYKDVQSGYDARKINRVILMTDGEANVGETDPDVLAQRVAALAADGGTTLTTIGVGLQFNGDFLKKLADAGKGSYYYVNSEADAESAFVGEAQALERTVARNVKLAITLADGVKLVQVFGHTAKTVGQSLNVDSNDLINGQSKVILLELEVPAGKVGDAHDLAKVAVDFDDVPFGGHKQATAAASVSYSDDQAAITAGTNGSIASTVIILQTAAVMLRAVDLLDQGQPQQAQQELASQYELVSGKATELGDADLANEALDLKSYLDRIGKDASDAVSKDMQFDAFQQQQGKKKVVAAAQAATATANKP